MGGVGERMRSPFYDQVNPEHRRSHRICLMTLVYFVISITCGNTGGHSNRKRKITFEKNILLILPIAKCKYNINVNKLKTLIMYFLDIYLQ